MPKNGCPLYDDCETCQFPDCVYPFDGSVKEKEKAINYWKGWLENALQSKTNLPVGSNTAQERA
jgi:hypothetical protein